jgi:prolipoprotein diacylglyceryltransferase
VGRLGCHNYGCCYGKPTQSRWAVVYTHPQAKVLRLQPQLTGIPLVPTQIYSAAFNFALFGLLLLVVASLPWDGLAFLVFLLAYNGFRMVIDPWRGRTSGEPPYAKVAAGIIALGMLYLGAHAIFAGQIFPYRPLDDPISLAGYITFLGSHWDALVGSLGVGLVAFVFYGVHGKTLGRHVR